MTKRGGRKEQHNNSHKRVKTLSTGYVQPVSPPPLSPLSNTPLTDAELLDTFGLFANPTNPINTENLAPITPPPRNHSRQQPSLTRSQNITRRRNGGNKTKKSLKKHKRKTRTRK